MVMKAALPCDNSKNEGKLNKNHIRAHYTEMEQCSPAVWGGNMHVLVCWSSSGIPSEIPGSCTVELSLPWRSVGT